MIKNPIVSFLAVTNEAFRNINQYFFIIYVTSIVLGKNFYFQKLLISGQQDIYTS